MKHALDFIELFNEGKGGYGSHVAILLNIVLCLARTNQLARNIIA